jgi:hypothetical protein
MSAELIPREQGGAVRAVAFPSYHRSREALGDAPGTLQIAETLEAHAVERPDAGSAVPGTVVRVLRTRRYGAFPALRLYYSVAEGVVHLLWIEEWDEMEP